jgi:hypothetical protein
MHRIAFAAILAAAILACASYSLPLQAQSGMAPAEQLLIPFSAEEWRSWRVGSQGRRPNFTMVEYIPKAQTVDNWDRMLTIQIFHNSPIQLSQLMGKMKETLETKQPCEKTVLRSVGTKKVNGYDASVHWLICSRNKQTGKGEFALMLGIRGRDALYLIQRAWRGPAYEPHLLPLAQAEFKAWEAFMTKVQVCDPRVPEQACPKGLRHAR